MANLPTILAIIPARKGSKGIPGKNMKVFAGTPLGGIPLGGKPLLQYTIESALQSTLLTKIIVSTDCELTIEFVQEWKRIEAPFLRPAALSDDKTSSLQVIRHAVEFYKNLNIEFDWICLLQPTSPFRSAGLIDKTVMHMLHLNADSLVTVLKIPDQFNPNWALTMSDNALQRCLHDAPLAIRRQELPDSFYRDGKVYLLKTSLLSQGLMSGKCVGYRTDDEPNVNIDTMKDWENAARYIAYGAIL
ncbi:cytidylyltransferase domain-containing protein [Dyadobacter sp. CY326]|uniref:acylneuraminate cytidylyltransferase family protein n=1 Tax=Dyadobacter sp. CY326 TaxID=2907300 RepID=UPI001F1E6FE3|nr:acylneuraminate cytidylyltransferase family protein [Dyadobacter sp. CY326]MCE7068077.1 acylneuraminate cytidylyltransferase family protein [Dyadobacter sp. CY326]